MMLHIDGTGGTGADGEVGASAVELAVNFCRGAERRVQQHFHDLWHNEDAENYDAAQQVLAGPCTRSETGVLDPSLLAPEQAAPDQPAGVE